MLRNIYIVEKPQINSFYWMQNIFELGLHHSRRRREHGKGKRDIGCLMHYHFPPILFGWLATNMQ
jgi:hypothetical protein